MTWKPGIGEFPQTQSVEPKSLVDEELDDITVNDKNLKSVLVLFCWFSCVMIIGLFKSLSCLKVFPNGVHFRDWHSNWMFIRWKCSFSQNWIYLKFFSHL